MSTEDDALVAEWKRAQGLGKRLARERFIATIAGMAPVVVSFVAAGLVYWFWPFDRIPIWVPAIVAASGLPVGWRIRNKPWPRGQFA